MSTARTALPSPGSKPTQSTSISRTITKPLVKRSASRRRVSLPAAAPTHLPTHPGEILREDVLPALRLSITKAALTLGVSRQTLHAILSERAAITPEMALRIGKLCGNGAEPWLRLQQARDLFTALLRLTDDIAAIPTLRQP